MQTRRDLLRSLAWLGVVAAGGSMAVGCAEKPAVPPDKRPGGAQTDGVAGSAKVRLEVGDSDRPLAVDAVTSFTTDLYRLLAAKPGNLVSSPYSVAVALAMTRNGARGTTAAEMDDVLHSGGSESLNGGLNSLTSLIESRAGQGERADGSKATVAIDVANSLWGQHDTEWTQKFLDALATNYGAGMHLVDYATDAEAARVLVNAWTAKQTHDRIEEILPEGVIDGLTRLVLVNAIYLKAPWEQPFDPELTEPRPFTRQDGSRVDAETMTGKLNGAGLARGDGWQAARLLYAGGELAMTVILPDDGDLNAFEQSVDGPRLTEILTSPAPVPILQLQLPRWTFRVQAALNGPLAALGMPTAFGDRADFSGMTTEEQLFISAVLHEAFIAVDEEGTEAAAATAVVMGVTSLPQVVPFVVDRPFMFVIHDLETTTPLFVGRVADPTA